MSFSRASSRLIGVLNKQTISAPATRAAASISPQLSQPITASSVSKWFLPRISVPSFRRAESTSSNGSQYPRPLSESQQPTEEEKEQLAQRRSQEPAYMITFTCRPCGNRSSHRISHHGYHKGTVLIQCPSCKNQHVISDHMKIFMDSAMSLEQILARHGRQITKGKLEGDVEWWQDGSIRSLNDKAEEQNGNPETKSQT